jgi:K+-transporting ATPase ATPase C chain
MLSNLRPAIVLLAAFTLITGLAFPLAITGIGQLVFPQQASGSLIEKNGTVIGSQLIGQSFSKPEYFHARPSATSDTDPNDSTKTVPAPYNANGSGGSNLAPTAKALVERVQGDVEALKKENPGADIPADLVTTSASGLDPHISPAAAAFQVKRVAQARGLSVSAVEALVEAHTEGRLFGLIGEPRVNVLELNLALDAAGH